MLDTLFFLKIAASIKKLFCFKTYLVKKELKGERANTAAQCCYESKYRLRYLSSTLERKTSSIYNYINEESKFIHSSLRPKMVLFGDTVLALTFCFVFKARKTKTTMRHEAFLRVVSKESVEDFLHYTQNSVSKP